MKIKIFIILFWSVCSLISFNAPASSQTTEQIRHFAGNSLRAADAIRVMAKASKNASDSILRSDGIKNLAPSEVALVVKTSLAAQKLLLKQADALDLLAIKLLRYSGYSK